MADIPPAAAKTGALGNAAVIEAVAKCAADFSFPLVVDPVMISKHGAVLLDEGAIEVMKHKLLPHSFLVTPNLPEAAKLAEMEVTEETSMETAAAAISRLGPKHVLIKGGHLQGPALDLLWSAGRVCRFRFQRTDTKDTHGTGCVLSAAITARLAKGDPLESAVAGAKQFVTQAIRSGSGLGSGYGPTNMHAQPDDVDL